MLAASGIGLALFLSCSFGLEAFWCLPAPLSFVAMMGASVLAGLGFGVTIRADRERRALERDDRAP